MTPNPTSPAANGHPPDAYDRLLADFFRNEMPHPWPGPRVGPAAAEVAGRRTDSGSRSRYTLAASVAVLLGLGAYLSSGTPAGRPAGDGQLLHGSTANGTELLKNAAPKPGERNPMPLPDMP